MEVFNNKVKTFLEKHESVLTDTDRLLNSGQLDIQLDSDGPESHALLQEIMKKHEEIMKHIKPVDIIKPKKTPKSRKKTLFILTENKNTKQCCINNGRGIQCKRMSSYQYKNKKINLFVCWYHAMALDNDASKCLEYGFVE